MNRRKKRLNSRKTPKKKNKKNTIPFLPSLTK